MKVTGYTLHPLRTLKLFNKHPPQNSLIILGCLFSIMQNSSLKPVLVFDTNLQQIPLDYGDVFQNNRATLKTQL